MVKKLRCPVCGERIAVADVDKHLIRDHFIATLSWSREFSTVRTEGK